MTILDAAAVSVLRDDHPHTSRFFLSVLQPEQVYSGTISGSPAKGDRTFTMVDVSGDITDLVEGMTLYVGTSEGDKSICKRRYRSRAGQVIKVDENAITLLSGQYITAYKNWELWGVLPLITAANPPLFYKDYDIAYTDENTDIPPVAVAGGPFVGFLSGGSLTFTLDATDSYAMAVGASITTYLWACDGGTIADTADPTTTITFNTAGQYWLDLTVGDGTKTQTIHTPIFVHEHSGANAPVTDFTISSDLQGDFMSGGYDMGIEMWDASVIDLVMPGGYCVLWKESTYNGTERYYGNNGNIQFVGYVIEESIVRNPQAGNVTFGMRTINGLLDTISMPSVSLEESDDTATWYRFAEQTLTVARAVHHLWRWHSTLFSIADVYLPTNLTDTMPACDDFENGSLYAMADNFTYQYSVFSKVCCDCAGRLHVEQDVNILDDSERAAIPIMMTLEAVDRRMESDVEFNRNNQQVACVMASGIRFDGSDYLPVISACPGSLYSDIGISVNNFERLLFTDQNHANVVSGRLFAIANQDVTELNMELAGDYPVELVPQVWWVLEDMNTKRTDIDLESIKAVCRGITFRIDLLSGIVYPLLTFEPEALPLSGIGDGETVVPPEDPTTPTGPIVIPPIKPPTSITTLGRFGWSFNISLSATGIVGFIEVPFVCTIDSVKLVAKDGEVGDIVIDIWKCGYASIATGTHPVDADSITGANPPTLSSAYKSITSLVGWTTSLIAGDWLFFNVDSFTDLTLVTLAISGVVYQ